MKSRLLVGAVGVLTLSAGHVHAVDSTTATPETESPEPWAADFEGVEIDLRDGWDGAKACFTDGLTTECWDSEPEMLLSMAADGIPIAGTAPQVEGASSFRRQVACTNFLRLYTGSNYSGAVLAISSRFTFLNLSGYGFNNSTSSYRVGACPAAFYDGNSGGGAIYPGATHEYAWGPSMLSGWDNRISSIYMG